MSMTKRVAMTEEELHQVPNARDPWGVLSAVPGVLLDRLNIAGNENGQQANFAGKGSTRQSANFNLDGLVITDMAATGASPGYYDMGAFQEISVSTGANDLQVLSGGLKLFLFGLGQGTLIVLCGVFAGLLARLPKSGQWMVTLKKGFAMLVIAGASLLLVYTGQGTDFPDLTRLLAAAEGGATGEEPRPVDEVVVVRVDRAVVVEVADGPAEPAVGHEAVCGPQEPVRVDAVVVVRVDHAVEVGVAVPAVRDEDGFGRDGLAGELGQAADRRLGIAVVDDAHRGEALHVGGGQA